MSLSKVVLCLCFLLWGSRLLAQPSGQHFVTAFLIPDYAPQDPGESFVYSLTFTSVSGPASVTVRFSGDAKFSKSFEVPADSSIRYIIGNDFSPVLYTDGVIGRNAIFIDASSPITVLAAENAPLLVQSEYSILPVGYLGNVYRLLAYRNDFRVDLSTSERDEVGCGIIVATEDSTRISVRLTAPSLRGLKADTAYSYVLNRGETVQIGGNGETQTNRPSDEEDVTGSLVTADRPITVISGHVGTQIPDTIEIYNAGRLVTSLPPISSAGYRYLLQRFLPQTLPDIAFPPDTGEQVRVMAVNGNTRVRLNGAPWRTLSAGGYHDTLINSPVFVEADAPIVVAEYCHSALNPADTIHTPFIVTAQPLDDLTDSAVFCVPVDTEDIGPPAFGYNGQISYSFVLNYLNLTVEKSAVGHVLLDGATIPRSEYTLFQTPEGETYGIARVAVPTIGRHTLSEEPGTTGRFQALEYSEGLGASCGYVVSSSSALRQQLAGSFRIEDRTIGLENIYLGTAHLDSARFIVDQPAGISVQSAEVVGQDLREIAVMDSVRLHLRFSTAPATYLHGYCLVYSHGDSVAPSSPARIPFYLHPELEGIRTASVDANDLFRVTPNPAADRLHVTATTGNGLDLTLLDILGREVLRKRMPGTTTDLDLSQLPPGTYYLQGTSGGRRSVQSLVIAR